jgi:hypothetical protein
MCEGEKPLSIKTEKYQFGSFHVEQDNIELHKIELDHLNGML